MPPPDEHAEFDRAEILAALDRHGVEYLLVGGSATAAYGARRPTYDVDCLPRSTDENLERLAAALKDLGARLRIGGVDDETAKTLKLKIDRVWLQRSGILNLRTDAGDLDVISDIPAGDHGERLGYDELAPRANTGTVDGVTVRLAALEDIIASKQHANRDKDREALPELYQLAKDARARRLRDNPGGGPGQKRPPILGR